MIAKNERNAGRRPALTKEQTDTARALYENGTSVTALAVSYGVSRQTMSRYLNEKKIEVQTRQKDGYVLRLEYMYREKICSVIWVNFQNRKVVVENRTDDILHRAFGVKVKPDWEDFEYFLESRCVPKSRAHIEDILNDLGLDFYDPLAIIEKTKGRMAEDRQWIRMQYLA